MLMAFGVERKDATNIKAQDERPVEYFCNLLPFLEAFPSRALLWSRWEMMEIRVKAMVETERFKKNILRVLLLGTLNCRVKERITDASWVCIVRKNYA